ncbi:MAG TPA: Trm112 family protein [Pilimelia sp.]|nr:Trm112 family protein [Pilimelia sp.]
MSLDPQLLEILACPDTHHAPLDYDPAAQTLTCTECRRVFEVRDDIPVLLLDEARQPTTDGQATDRPGTDRPAAGDGA